MERAFAQTPRRVRASSALRSRHSPISDLRRQIDEDSPSYAWTRLVDPSAPTARGGSDRSRSTTLVMRSLAVAVGCLALAMTGLARSATGLRVPAVVGMSESRAQCTLAAAGLRWSYRGDKRVYTRPIITCGGRSVVLPDPVVISESPRAGTRVVGGSVIVLDDACLRRLREHRSACM
jgi:hypothetical protein